MILYILAAIGAVFMGLILLMVLFYFVSSWILRNKGGCWGMENSWTREQHGKECGK